MTILAVIGFGMCSFFALLLVMIGLFELSRCGAEKVGEREC